MTHRERSPAQGWIIALFYGRKERVHIDVNDLANQRVAHDREAN